MSFFLVRSLIPMRVDPGDSTDIIHKRILKGTRRWRAGRGDPRGRISPEIGFICLESGWIVRPGHPFGAGPERFTDEVQ
jgi:hypothetical protein